MLFVIFYLEVIILFKTFKMLKIFRICSLISEINVIYKRYNVLEDYKMLFCDTLLLRKLYKYNLADNFLTRQNHVVSK